MGSSSIKNNNRLSLAMERTGQCRVFSQEVPTDVVVEVGGSSFNLHKFMLVAKSNYIRKIIFDSEETDLARIDLSDIPGGPEIFEKAAKFCYGVNFEISVHNVAALRCATEYLQMTDKYSDNNLAGRTEDFLSQVALSSLSGALVVLRSCEELLPLAEDLGIVKRCVDIASAKACNKANFPCQSPPNWWAEELTILDISFFGKIIDAMKTRGTKNLTLATAIVVYAERSLRDLVRDNSRNSAMSSYSSQSDAKSQQRELLESIVALMPTEKTVFPINFLCCLLRTANDLRSSERTKNELERKVSGILEYVSVDDLLVLDLESVRRIVSGFVEREKNVAVFDAGSFEEVCSGAMQRVAKTVNAYLAEIATYEALSVSKFNGIASLVPKGARKVDDDLYRAIDIYLKAHPNLDEIEREKACSCMDPLKLSYDARLHASQNKRLPVQVVLHALYYDQLNIRSGSEKEHTIPDAVSTRKQLETDLTLVKENEALRTELVKMKMYITDIQKNTGTSSKKPTFFSSMSKRFGKLNPFKHGSKDTSNIEDEVVLTKPKRRRFSIS